MRIQGSECIVILVILGLWVALGAITARIMKKKGRLPGYGWILGMALPVLGLIIAALLPPKQ